MRKLGSGESSQEKPQLLVPAAQYLRTSRHFQEAYLKHQETVIADFAKKHGFRIVRTYQDSGRSGLVLRTRPGMQRLLGDVLQGRTNFSALLVYNVARWGRFQDVDEAAHYEFLCKSHDVPVYYCDEPFVNGNTPAASIFKHMKRSQAGEFSRELSDKVFRAQKHMAALGFRLGGRAGYGLRRMIITPEGEHVRELASGEYKYSNTNPMTLVPGPKNEVELVQEMYAMAAYKHMGCQQITDDLNRRCVLRGTGESWDYYDVLRILTNPKYMGTSVWVRTSGKLQSKRRNVSPENWTAKPAAFTGIVDAQVFNRVQEFLRSRKRDPWTDEELLLKLKALLKRKGYLNQGLIDETPGFPSSATYYAHFGPLRKVYPLIGYRPPKGTFTKIVRRDQNEKLRARLLTQIQSLFSVDVTLFHIKNKKRLILRLDNGLSVSVVLCRSLKLGTGDLGWKLYPTRTERDYITLLCRLNRGNQDFLDFHLFPYIEKRSWYLFADGDPWFKKGKVLRRLEDLCIEAKIISRLDAQ